MATLQPLHDRVLIRRVEAERITPGGIILSEAHLDKPQEGEIVAVGPGVVVDGRRQPLDVNPGDRVIFGKWSGSEIKLNDEMLLIMKEEDILGILNKE